MPTQPVIEKLTELQAELETISSAVKHIDTASKVAQTAAEIAEKTRRFINDFRSLEEKHYQELLIMYKGKIDSLEKQNQKSLNQIEESSNKLNHLVAETKALEKTISNYFSEIQKINFPERLSKIDNQISSINIGIGNLQTLLQESLKKIDKNGDRIIDRIQETAGNIKSGITSYVKTSITEQNLLLKKELRTNRIITISFGIVITGCILLMLFLSQS